MAITIAVGPSVEQSGAMSDTDTVVLTGVTAGQTIVAGVLWASASVVVNEITCTGESNLTLGTSYGPDGPSGTSNVRFGYLSNVTASGDKTIRVNLSGTVVGAGLMFAVALSGADTAGAFDAENGSAGTGATLSTSITAAANSAIFAIGNSTNGTLSVGANYTLISGTNTRHWYTAEEYDLDAGTAGAKTVDMTTGGSGTWKIAGIAIKAAGGGASAPLAQAQYFARLRSG